MTPFHESSLIKSTNSSRSLDYADVSNVTHFTDQFREIRENLGLWSRMHRERGSYIRRWPFYAITSLFTLFLQV